MSQPVVLALTRVTDAPKRFVVEYLCIVKNTFGTDGKVLLKFIVFVIVEPVPDNEQLPQSIIVPKLLFNSLNNSSPV